MAHYSKIPYVERIDYQGFVFMAKRSSYKNNVEQKDVFEEIVSDNESSVEEEIDYEKELIVVVDAKSLFGRILPRNLQDRNGSEAQTRVFPQSKGTPMLKSVVLGTVLGNR